GQFACSGQFRDKRQAAATGELHADLIKDRALADLINQPPRLTHIRDVERHDQTIERRKPIRLSDHWLHPSSSRRADRSTRKPAADSAKSASNERRNKDWRRPREESAT